MTRRREFCWLTLIGAGFLICGPSTEVRAYRLLSEDPSLGVSGRVGWVVPVISYSVSSRGLPSLSETAYRSAIQRGFNAWTSATCEVAFADAGTISADAAPGDGANTVQWTEYWLGRGFAADAIATTDVQFREVEGEWRIVEFDMYFQSGLSWAVDAGVDAEYRVDYVAAHEAGHALGIAHPCDEATSGVSACGAGDAELMHPIYASRGVAPTPDDIAAVCALYDCDTTGPACGNASCVAEPVAGCPCADQSNCSELLCVRSRCAPTRLSDGDTCDTADDCESGACVGRVCAEACPAGSECGPGAACVVRGSGARACEGEVADFASSCADSVACASGLCVATRGGADGLCTRSCLDIPCPGDFVCVAADGQRVCALPDEDAGCNATAERAGWGGGGTTVVPLAMMMVLIAWRRLVSAKNRREK